MSDLDEFLDGYCKCALWNMNGGDRGVSNYTQHDISNETLNAMRVACNQFMRVNAVDLDGWTPEKAGWDFWMAHNRIFSYYAEPFLILDRGVVSKRSKRLMAEAKAYPELDLLLGSDGKLHHKILDTPMKIFPTWRSFLEWR